MHRASSGAEVANLPSAREAVGNNNRVGRRGLNSGNQPARADRFRYFVMLAVVAESPRHAAATRVEHFDFEPGSSPKQASSMVYSHQRLLMAMPLHDHRVTQLRRCGSRRITD